MSVMTLAIMNVTAVVSLRGLPAEAVYGLSSAFYYLFAAIVFLIPTAMVAAELAAMFADKQGGVFRWVGEAYGARTGFLAIWLQWIESTIWYPTVLTFGAVSIAFIGMNDTHDAALASNKVFTLCMVLAIYWIATLIALKGLGWVGKISKWGGMIGTIIPAGLLIVLGIIYISTGLVNTLGFKVATFEFTAPPRFAGHSKYNLRKMLHFALDGITSFSNLPLRWAFYIGMVFGLMSFLVILHVLYVKYVADDAVPGWATMTASVLFLGGIQLVGIGILGEYIGRIFEEVKQRPLYIVGRHLGKR